MLNLSQADHDILDEFLNAMLDEYRDGHLTQMQARTFIGEAVSLAAKDNENITLYMKAKINSRGKDI